MYYLAVMLVAVFLMAFSAPCLGISVQGRELKASMSSKLYDFRLLYLDILGFSSMLYYLQRTTTISSTFPTGYYVMEVDALYHAPLKGKFVNPPVMTHSSGFAEVIVFNNSYALGSYSFTDIDGVYMAHIHNGSSTFNGYPVVWALNSSCARTLACAGLWQPFSVPAKSYYTSSYSFNSSLPVDGTTIGHQLAMGLAYFNVHTIV
jgi:hypothetical protein